jgi:di-heme oxidoreductase (putative peroxidase)
MHEHRYCAIMSLSLAVLGLDACTTEGGAAAPLDEPPAHVATPLETTVSVSDTAATQAPPLGTEVAIARHLADGDEYNVSLRKLLRHGQQLFEAVFTPQEGGGRPLSKGTGDPLSDPTSPLVFPRGFNRISAMDANSCTSCHNVPFVGGGGHFTSNAVLVGQRFDFLTFNHADTIPTRGAVDERGLPVLLQSFNSRATIGMLGSGFIEMLARQITTELRSIRDATPLGGSRALSSKGISYGQISRGADGSWNTSAVVGIPASSLVSSGPLDPPSLIVRAFHQSGTVISIRQFTNNAFNHHLGMQSTERFGVGTDPDGDGFTNELTRADVTAAAIFQATLPIPGRVIPNDRRIEQAVLLGERRFSEIGCATCHLPSLPLDQNGWVYSEPNPFNPAGNLRPGDAPALSVDLTSGALPGPRLKARNGVVMVPAFTDLKLHDITTGPGDPNIDPLDMNQPTGSAAFFAGNAKFLTKKLWGCANEPPFFHHGMFPTLRQAILAHAGEANTSAQAFRALAAADQAAVIEFLKTLQALPADAEALVVDEDGHAKTWPPHAGW